MAQAAQAAQAAVRAVQKTQAERARRPYAAPSLAEYGRLETLTLGATGPLPDYLGGGLVIGPGCETQTFIGPGGATLSRTSCGVASAIDSGFH